MSALSCVGPVVWRDVCGTRRVYPDYVPASIAERRRLEEELREARVRGLDGGGDYP